MQARASRLEAQAERSILSRLAPQDQTAAGSVSLQLPAWGDAGESGIGGVTEPAVAAIVEPWLRFRHIPSGDFTAIAFTIAMGISTSLHIVIGEQAPKNWAISYSDWLLPIVAGPLVIFTYVCFPVIWLLNFVTQRRLASDRREDQSRRRRRVAAHRAGTARLLAQSVAQERSAKAMENPRQRV